MVGHIDGLRTSHTKFFDGMVIRAGVGFVVTSLFYRDGSVDGYTQSDHALYRDWGSPLKKTDIWHLHMSSNL